VSVCSWPPAITLDSQHESPQAICATEPAHAENGVRSCYFD
jgi:hypothetical protein